MRWVIARVLPVPAPASTRTGPRSAVATSRCSGSSPSRSSSADACTACGAVSKGTFTTPPPFYARTPSGEPAGSEEPYAEERTSHGRRLCRHPAGDDVLDDVVRVLLAPQVADAAGGDRLRGRRHRAPARGRRARRA